MSDVPHALPYLLTYLLLAPRLRLIRLMAGGHNLYGGRGRIGQGLAGSGTGGGGNGGRDGEAGEAHEGGAQGAQREEGGKGTVQAILACFVCRIRWNAIYNGTQYIINTNWKIPRIPPRSVVFVKWPRFGLRWWCPPRCDAATNFFFPSTPARRRRRHDTRSFSTSARARERERDRERETERLTGFKHLPAVEIPSYGPAV